jgi:hypothetical protein
MSLLDLNSGKGSSPRMKRGVKIWIGAGLIAAIAGIGSTLATNITLNGGNQTEFGQGVAQTVSCAGTSQTVTVTPISAYVNSDLRRGSAAVASVWVNPSWSNTPTFQEVSSSSSTNTFTSTYVNDATGVSESVKGYWIQSSRSSSSWYTSSNAPSSNYVFVPQAIGTSSTSYNSRTMSTTATGSNKYGYWKYQSWVAGSFTAPIAEVADSEGPHSFELSGIAVTGIPDSCDGIDFVVSVYKNTGQTKKSIITSCRSSHSDAEALSDEISSFSEGDERRCSINVKEVAVQWQLESDDSTPPFSIDRTGLTPNPYRIDRYLTVNTFATGGIKIILSDRNGTRLSADDVGKIVVETQDDLIVPNA